MATKPGRPSDDVSSAPESGTVRDTTSGNGPARPHDQDKSQSRSGKPGKAGGNEGKTTRSGSGEER